MTNVVQYDSNFNLSIGSSTSSSFNSSGSIIAASGFTGSLSGSVFGLGNTVSFSSSVSSDLVNLESKSASVDISITNINSFTASNANQSLNQLTGSLATTGSNTFYGTQVFSGSVFIATDLIVQGSSSIQYISASSVSIGTNIVQLNTANPSVRFAGLTIIDSGSVGGSGSFLYDSLQDEFIFVHRGNGTNVTSSHFVLGPETYDSLGNELYLTCNRISKGTGNEHLVDSCIFDNGTTTCIKNNLVGTGTISGTTLYGSTTVCSPIGLFSGCVGIGTNSPTGRLHLKAPSNDIVLRFEQQNDITSQYYFNIDSAVNGTLSLITNYLGGNVVGFSQNRSGFVGIGTIDPPEPLSVSFASHGLISQHRPSCSVGVGQNFYMKFNNVVGTAVNYAGIYSDIQANTNGAHSGRMILQVANNGSLSSAVTIANTGITTFSNTLCAPLFTTTNGVAAIGAGPSSTEIFTATGPGSSNGMYLVIYSQQGTPGSATGMAYLNIWNNASVDVYNIFCQSLSNVTNSGTSVRIQSLSGNGGFTAVYSVIRLR